MKNYSLLLLCACLTSCSGFKEKIGLTRMVPNEFETIKQDPLIVPSTLKLPPPGQNKGRQSQSSADKAKVILGLQEKDLGSSSHEGEKSLLAQAQAHRRDPNIREKIQPVEAEETLHDKIQQTLVFWKKPEPKGRVIDPEKEKKALNGDR